MTKNLNGMGYSAPLTELHAILATARTDYIEHGGNKRMVVIRDATEPYVDALEAIVEAQPTPASRYEVQLAEATSRINALNLDIAPHLGATVARSLGIGLGASFIGGMLSAAFDNELIGQTVSSVSVGCGLAIISSDLRKQGGNPATAIHARAEAAVGLLSPTKTTKEIVRDENETIIIGLRNLRRKGKLITAGTAALWSAGVLAGRIFVN